MEVFDDGWEYFMLNNISYNQIISLSGTEKHIECQTVIKSYSEGGNLIFFLEDSRKLIIDGKKINTTGNKERINEIISMVAGKGFNIPESSIKHYVQMKDTEHVLVKL